MVVMIVGHGASFYGTRSPCKAAHALSRHAAVDRQVDAGDVAAVVRGEEQDTLKDTIPPRALAHYIGGLTQGITTYARPSGDPKATLAMAETARTFLESLRATPKRR
jgi:hypothetical protein